MGSMSYKSEIWAKRIFSWFAARNPLRPSHPPKMSVNEVSDIGGKRKNVVPDTSAVAEAHEAVHAPDHWERPYRNFVDVEYWADRGSLFGRSGEAGGIETKSVWVDGLVMMDRVRYDADLGTKGQRLNRWDHRSVGDHENFYLSQAEISPEPHAFAQGAVKSNHLLQDSTLSTSTSRSCTVLGCRWLLLLLLVTCSSRLHASLVRYRWRRGDFSAPFEHLIWLVLH